MIRRTILLCLVSLTAGVLQIQAQPGVSNVPFDSWRVCQPEYHSEELVFVGQVNGRDERTFQVGNRSFWGIDLIEIESLKGSVAKTSRIYLDKSFSSKAVEIGKKYIFTAHRSQEIGRRAVVSNRWSTALDSSSKDASTTLTKRIQFVAAGEKQPSVTGKIVRYAAAPFDVYEFRGRSLLTKTGYDPKYAAPLKGVRLIAKNVKGKTFETVTDANGEFEFENLPSESYEITPVLPANTVIKAFQYFLSPFEPEYRPVEEGRLFFPVYNEVCAADIRFNVK